ncbi:adenine-specific DNA methylase [Schinkia azotoformans MEV2011]|uniref:Adenine-specific DNA methylase n=1 Tax=Schinkia azotoformans MEV2011 TaxID=1348973 RepID=A0A072P2A3_SCHAZ|nr:class I SAM-dependent methyltransferase [Schinkia azotoformans]KEF39595.1 adenine-specific DNA methylase [Schinkia azotoformans MEV2011]MEC1694285.1 class I SAM-dependent methyltransferase [Schinkia azotoformans]MEC1714914.1 class I SAM-dependent methyltransferase [Schinkia azotoformans]MEC1723501.1 class I SAM-dependent methyltransferase [Schinkia azotoformans]MEC1742851.1 class I SAM-dependent methyltransferase [Schinkia azotoformans]
MAATILDMEKLFQLFDNSTTIIMNELHISYLEALAETGANIFEGEILQDLDSFTERRLQKEYEGVDLSQASNEMIRKAFQLAILKGMKEAIQPNHEMTPDAVSIFISYLVEKLMSKKEQFSLLDPAYGTGNLVTAILNNTNKAVKAYGVEVDEILMKLAFAGANLQRHEIELFRQDALQPIFVEAVDIVVADVPVGFYPNDVVANEYELANKSGGHSLAHYLYIEKSLKHLKDGGFFVAMIPNFMFEGEEAANLNAFIKKNVVIIGLLQLPLSMFKNNKHAKSIFILQKKGEDVREPKQALLAELPSFSKKEAMRGIIKNIDNWFKENL